jgi:hypothetical protein
MSTTIQVKDITKQRLDFLKEKLEASSYDEVINKVTEKEFGSARAMFGSLKGIGPWKKSDRARSKYE